MPFKYAPEEGLDAFTVFTGDPSTGCTSHTDSEVTGTTVELGTVRITQAAAVGFDGAQYPGTGPVAVISRVDSACDGFTDSLEAMDLSSSASGPDPTWEAVTDDSTGTLSTLGDCLAEGATGSCADPDACSGQYVITVLPTSEDVGLCQDLSPVRAELEVEFPNDGSTPVESDCTPGTARFSLFPLYSFDSNGDGLLTVVMRAVELTGTAVMTNRADITSVSPVGTMPATLRVVERGHDFHLDADDHLVDQDEVSSVVSGTTSFGADTVGGNPPFIFEGVSLSAVAAGKKVDATWTCGTTGATHTASQGYQLRLSDAGCSAVQKLTVRPVLTGTRRLDWEFYGDGTHRIPTPLGISDSFSYSAGTLAITGAWLGTVGQNARIRLDSITVGGLPQCSTGVYTLTRE